MQVVNTGERYAQPANERAHFRRRSCPADNSCLFHACAYILKDKNRTDGPKLRMQCVEYVLHHPKIYTEAGEDPMKYASWLAQPNTWGGYMEMVALSEMHQVEIIALDLESTTIIRCGENKNYPLRGYVVFTGNHYDAIAMSTSTNLTDESQDQVLFNPRDEAVFQKAVDFVKEEGRKGR